MQNLRWYWRRIRSMDAAEVAWRIKSLARDQVDSVRIPLGLVPKLRHEQQFPLASFEPGFQCSPITPADWQGPLSKQQIEWRRRLLEKADLILQNKLLIYLELLRSNLES